MRLTATTWPRSRISFPWNRIRWLEVPVTSQIRPGRVQPEAGRAAYACLEKAVRSIRAGEADALVTAPVSKEAIVCAGIRWRGHTEYLASRFRSRTTMMFVTGCFRASLVTTHWAIREVPSRLRKSDVVRVLRQTRQALIRDFGIGRPRIGLAALNPHGGENGMFGSEEKQILLPAARSVSGVEGPVPADNLIPSAVKGRYDAVVCLYHDQALVPLKLIGWEQAVNVTLGLPFVRTSPVHGTAFDIAGRGKADPASMRAAIRLAIQLARRRA